ncbi:general secretion pathway protein G [Aliiroseovarius halocynthiae]|nr:general secretion pathway protein G [Aliiroseovarius halocynthiae]
MILRNTRKMSRKSGMTILEVLIVLTVIALIAAVAGPRLVGYLGRAKTETAALQIKQISNALQLFYIDMGRYPSDAEGLAVLVTRPAGETAWTGPYMETAEALLDPWGRDYIYAEPGADGVLSVTSLGRDGAPGGTGEDADLSL